MKHTDTFDDDALDYRPRPKWPMALLLSLLVLGGGGWFAWQMTHTLNPVRVLVAIDFQGHWFEGSKPAAQLVDSLTAQLEGLGFEPVKSGDPEVLAVLEAHRDDLPAAARALKASYLVTGEVKATEIPHAIGKQLYHEVRAVGTLEVSHAEDATPTTVTVQSWGGELELEKIYTRLSQRLFARKVSAAVIPLLINHPILAGQIGHGAKDGQAMDAKITAKLSKAAAFVVSRTQALSDAKKAYAAMKARRLEGEKGRVRYHGTMAEKDGLIGTGALGFLVKTDDLELYVDPRNSRLARLGTLETLVWKSTEGPSKVLWQGYNLYSYPGMNADGSAVALVEDLFGWAKTVTLIGKDGQAKRLVVDPKKRFSQVTPSPDGQKVAFLEKECRRCDSGLVVIDAQSTELFRDPAPKQGRYQNIAWINDGQVMVLHTPNSRDPEAEEAEQATLTFQASAQTVWRLTLASKALTPIYTVPEGLTLSWATVNPKGEQMAFAAEGVAGPAIAVLDIKTKLLTQYPSPGPVASPSFAPGGIELTFNVWPKGGGRDEEVGYLYPGHGDITVLTANSWRDRYPKFSIHTDMIFFESMDKDPNFPKRRRVSVIGSVGLPKL